MPILFNKRTGAVASKNHVPGADQLISSGLSIICCSVGEVTLTFDNSSSLAFSRAGLHAQG